MVKFIINAISEKERSFKLIFFATLTIIFTSISCDDCKRKDFLPVYGTASFKINGKLWKGNITELSLIKDTVMIIKVREYKNKCDEYSSYWGINFIILNRWKNQTTLQRFPKNSDSSANSTATFYKMASLDAGCDQFLVHDSDTVSDDFNITTMNEDCSVLNATFSMSMKYHFTHCDGSPFGETIQVTEGKIHFKKNE